MMRSKRKALRRYRESVDRRWQIVANGRAIAQERLADTMNRSGLLPAGAKWVIT
jgi:hypothetical protein